MIHKKSYGKKALKKGEKRAFGKKDAGEKKAKGDMEFMPVSGLFEGKSGSYSVFLKEDMNGVPALEILRGLNEDDMIGVTEQDNGRLSLWVGKRS